MRPFESERERLERTYQSFNDADLLALDTTELTDDGLAALAVEMRRRKLVRTHPPQPAELDLAHRTMREEESPDPPDEDGLAPLHWFTDGMELSKACAALEHRKIPFEINVIEGDAMLHTISSFKVRIDPADRLAAQAALRDAMGYFPLQEVDGELDRIDGAEPVPFAYFETAGEADKAAAILDQAGIAFTREQEIDEEDGLQWSFEVSVTDLERATDLLARALNVS